MSKKQFLYFLVGIHLIFFIKQLFFGYIETKDGYEYLWAAGNLTNDFLLYCQNPKLEFRHEWLTKRPFLYPFILYLSILISFGKFKLFLFIIFLIQNALSIFNVYLILKILEKYKIKLNFLTIILFFIAFVSQFIYANLIMSEIWLQTCLTLCFYVFLTKSESHLKWVSISLLIIAGMSLKPVMIFAAILLPIFKIYYHKSKYIKSSLVTMLPVIFYLIIIFINYKRVGIAEYYSIYHINELHYNAYLPLVKKYGVAKSDSIIDEIVNESKSFKSYKEAVNFKRKSATLLIKQNFKTYLILHIKGIFVNFIDPGRYDLGTFFKINFQNDNIYKQYDSGFISNYFSNKYSIILLIIFVLKVYFYILFLFFLINKNMSKIVKLTIIIFIFYFVFLTGIIGASRFFMPLIPIYLFAILLFNKKTSDVQL